MISDLETKMLRIMKRVGCERVVPNHRIEVGNSRYSIDFAFPKHLVGIETHGLRWHFGEDKWKDDLKRDRALTLAGWTMLYFSRDDVLWSPTEVLAQTESVLVRATPLF